MFQFYGPSTKNPFDIERMLFVLSLFPPPNTEYAYKTRLLWNWPSLLLQADGYVRRTI
jgi:hypothetical protein